jgi:hypothetical protein
VSVLYPEDKLNGVLLDYEQRKRANRLYEAIYDDPMQAAFEIIWLRDQLAQREQSSVTRT